MQRIIEGKPDDFSHSCSKLQNLDYQTLMEQIENELSKFDLTTSQCKVYLFLARRGPNTALTVSKELMIPRTQAYHLLTDLQNKGLVLATFTHPIIFSAIPINDAIRILIDLEETRLKKLKNKKREIIQIWHNIPEFINKYNDENEDKFQILKGVNQSDKKIGDMINTAKKEILIMGSEKDFVGFYHSDLLEQLCQLDCELKIITDFSEKNRHLLGNINQNCIKKMPIPINENICFIIKDREEILFFMKNGNHKPQDRISMWTNLTSLIISMLLLFDLFGQKN